MPTQKPSETSPKPLPTLRYIGPGYLSDIPARDLSPDDLEALATQPFVKRRFGTAKELADLLVTSSLYELNQPSSDAKE